MRGDGRVLFGGHVTSSEDVVFLISHGFDFGEVVLRDGLEARHFKDLAASLYHNTSFFLIAHGPSEGPPNDLEHLWQIYYPKLMRTLEIAEQLDIHFLTVHLWFDPRFVRPHVCEEKLKFMEEIAHAATPHGILISLENLSENASDLALVVQRVPNISLTLDVGHGQLLAERNTSYEIVNKLYQWIGHVHLHDNYGGNSVKDDLHLPIGSGRVEIQQILLNLIEKGYRGTATLELKPHELESSLNTVRGMIAGFGRLRCAQGVELSH